MSSGARLRPRPLDTLANSKHFDRSEPSEPRVHFCAAVQNSVERSDSLELRNDTQRNATRPHHSRSIDCLSRLARSLGAIFCHSHSRRRRLALLEQCAHNEVTLTCAHRNTEPTKCARPVRQTSVVCARAIDATERRADASVVRRWTYGPVRRRARRDTNPIIIESFRSLARSICARPLTRSEPKSQRAANARARARSLTWPSVARAVK